MKELLVVGQFRNPLGLTVTIKRSKCRHYFVRVGTQNQRRVPLDEVRKAVRF